MGPAIAVINEAADVGEANSELERRREKCATVSEGLLPRPTKESVTPMVKGGDIKFGWAELSDGKAARVTDGTDTSEE